MRNLWTEAEKDLIRQGVPDEEILRRTGRTIHALAKMKYRLQRNEVSENTEPELVSEPLAVTLSQEEKESRLYKLMAVMKVRLG